MDQATLDTLQSSLRRLVPDSLGDTIAEIKKHLPEFAVKFSPLLLLESRLNDANLQRIQGILSDEDLALRYNQLRADVLLFINELEVNDFQIPLAGAPAGKSGSLLYKIPTHMTLLKETKCVVRLAFEKESIIRNIELDQDVEIKSVRVAEVMQVELIDPTEPHPFSIRSISDEEQFVEKGDFSEWVFYVKPLLEGTFPLVLKISVIEVVMGKERLRNLTYEENIQITATIPEAKEPAFKATGITLDATNQAIPEAELGAGTSDEEVNIGGGQPFPAAPPSPAAFYPEQVIEMTAPPRTKAPAPQQPKRRSNIGWMVAAASILLFATVAIFINNNSSKPEQLYPAPNIPSNEKTELEDTTVKEDTLSQDSIHRDSLQ